MITKKTIKKIRKGDYDSLINAIEFLLDTYDEDKWDLGYGAALADMNVRAYRLAEHIADEASKKGKLGKDCKGESLYYFKDTDELAKVIEDYFTNALKQ